VLHREEKRQGHRENVLLEKKKGWNSRKRGEAVKGMCVSEKEGRGRREIFVEEGGTWSEGRCLHWVKKKGKRGGGPNHERS